MAQTETTAQTKQDLRRDLVEARAALKSSLIGLPEDTLSKPFLNGGWCIRDILCHLCAWDREAVNGAREALSGCPARFLDWDWDEFNASQVAMRSGHQLHQILSELDHGFNELLDCLDAIPDRTLFSHTSPWEDSLIDPAEFFRVVAKHDRQHTAQIVQFRKTIQPRRRGLLHRQN
jgi:hypothetical protein